MIVEVGLGALALYVLAKAVGSSPPKGSEPTEFPQLAGKSPSKTVATAASGRQYELWTWPPVPGIGIYAVAKAKGASPWFSFTNNTELGTKTPAKTNVSEVVADPAAASQLLALMRSDWMV